MENYKKKYEAVLNRVKDYFEGKTKLYSNVDETLKYLFPELKESEDERIRKSIIDLVEKQMPKSENKKWMIAWLEKQGEHANFRNKIQIGDKVTRNEDGALVNISQFKRIVRQSEQKSTDKIEPKFKIEKSHWYVCIQSFVLNGNTVVIKGQTYKSQEDNTVSGENARLFIDKHDGDASKYFRPWTIQDAKDGDVLCYEDEVFILKSYVLFHKIVYHCCYDGKNLILHSIYSLTKDDFNKIHPATKEQRDLLFQKMKEAGYEWDAEKKELRKIENKIIEIPFGTDSELVEETIIIPNGCYAVIKDNKVILRKGEQKPVEWSAYDKATLEYIIEDIKELCDNETEEGSIETYNRELNLLQAINESIKLSSYTNPAAWSEEDEDMLKSIITTCQLLEQARDSSPARHLFEMQVNWLKSIKERMKGE